mmetsp:Transcript_9424/g.19547  ORF Transcript_9424/g.19547 Transcript_9424/m.19547 type:complete len:361 (+) Transcript_9424:483-1565(+)
MDLSRLEVVVLVQEPSARIPIDRAVSCLVNDGLPVVLAVGFQIQLPQSIRSRIKLERVVARLGYRLLDLIVLNGNRGVLDQSGIRETNLAGHVFKVVPIQGSAQAFSPQDLVFLEGFGDAAIGVNVREIQFAAGLEQIQTFRQNGLFVAAKIDDTVTNNHVKGSWFEVEVLEVFKVSLFEFHVGVSIFFRVVVEMLGCHLELLVCHVHTNNLSGRSHQLTGNVHIASTSASQIENVASLELVLRQTQTAAIVFGNDLGVNVLDGVLDVFGRGSGRATGVCLQIFRRGQFLSVIVADRSPGLVNKEGIVLHGDRELGGGRLLRGNNKRRSERRGHNGGGKNPECEFHCQVLYNGVKSVEKR